MKAEVKLQTNKAMRFTETEPIFRLSSTLK